jgi:lipopolysaccharide export system protein LptA
VRLTIERLRTLILAAGILLVAALVAFLVIAHWRSRFNVREIPQRLGVNIKQEANGVTYTQSRQGHTLFKIHASRVVQLKQNGRALLHDVQIELYGPDGKALDRIVGDEFEYDQKAGTATAAGPVEIAITRAAAPAALDLGKKPSGKEIASALQNVTHAVPSGQMNVKTSGLTFDQKTGIASTEKRVEFSTAQGNGSAVGATFDSQNGQLLLSHAVDLSVQRGQETVHLRAQNAVFNRDQMLCTMQAAEAAYRDGSATAGQALILFRPDGSAARLDASRGFTLRTAAGSQVDAPTGWLLFNQHSQPQRGQLQGGVTMDSSGNGRLMRGSAPTADLAFDSAGELRHAHLERGVTMHSRQEAQGAKITRDWQSQVADMDFRREGVGQQMELASVHGSGGVIIASQTQHGSAPMSPSRMTADDISARFGPHQELTQLVGVGHAGMEQTTATGARQTTSGDRLEAHFAPGTANRVQSGAQIESATFDGHVILTDQAAEKPGQPPSQPLRATAAHAVYEGAGQLLHLTGEPRVDQGGLQLTADRLDVSQASGDAFARGNVKATWTGSAAASQTGGTATLGGQGPAHAIAAEAQLNKATGEVTFRGQARLWQQANSISAPVIVLNQGRQTLLARGSGAAQPVNLVLLSAAGAGQGKRKAGVVRVRADDLKYSEAERKAFLRGSVTAQTDTATIASDNADIVLLPPGNHAGPDGGAAQVDRIVARGRVQVNSQGRRGTGMQLVYSSETDDYVLTGTLADPPQITDPIRGVVTGQALIFNGRNDSVSIEGDGRKTTTKTVAPR